MSKLYEYKILVVLVVAILKTDCFEIFLTAPSEEGLKIESTFDYT